MYIYIYAPSKNDLLTCTKITVEIPALATGPARVPKTARELYIRQGNIGWASEEAVYSHKSGVPLRSARFAHVRSVRILPGPYSATEKLEVDL